MAETLKEKWERMAREQGRGFCNCAVCLYGLKVETEIAKLPDGSQPFFRDMYERLMYAEFERDWCELRREQIA